MDPSALQCGEKATYFSTSSVSSSSSAARKPIRDVVRKFRWIRRIVQGLFLILFLLLLLHTTFRGSFSANPDSIVLIPWSVDWFFYIDPYASLLVFLSTWTVYKASVASVIVVLLTLVFGRVFCGWICPMGTMHHVLGWLLPSNRGKGAKRIAANRTAPARQRVKYYILYASIGAAVAGSVIGGLFDPIAFLVRSLGMSVLPSAQYVVGRFYENTSQSDYLAVILLGDGINYIFSHAVWQSNQFHYNGGWIIGVLFVVLLFMNRIIPRFWCRVLCPLGAMLGILSRFSLFGLVKYRQACTDCNLCLLHCQGADSPQGGEKWLQHECHMCLNCENACPENAIEMRFLPNRENTASKPDTVRRTALATTFAGLAVIPAVRTSGAFGPNFDADRIRPPGAVDEREFLGRCIRCGVCMKVCPNNALHAALGVGGLEALWTPIVVPRVGYCEQSCFLCAQVCPTGAINRTADLEQGGSELPSPIKIGTAFYDHGRCLPWAMQIPCIVCEEFCPTSPKAIWVEEVEVIKRENKHSKDGGPPETTTIKLQRPHVDPSLCVGCGACEKVCPVVDKPAIRVSSVGEKRSKTNAILLRNTE